MGEQNQQRSEESLRHEYTEAVETYRHYSNLRFAIYTIFFAVIGGAGFVAFGKGQFDAHAAMIARFGGFAVIALFWWYGDRVDQLFAHYRSEAVELKRSLGYKAFTSWPTRSRYLPNFRNVGRIFFILFALLWLYAVFAVPYI